MKILGVESSGNVASVAIVEDAILVGEYTINNKKTHSQTLLPMIEQVLEMAGSTLEGFDAIATSSGPGSFTGLRIGAATVKGLGLATGLPVVSVPTLEGLAYNLAGADALVCPMMDARRGQVYTGLYRVALHTLEQKLTAEDFQIVLPGKPMDIHEILEEINRLSEKVIFLGDGVPVQKETIEKLCKVPYHFAPPHMSRQRAGSVAVLGALYYEQGKTETAAEHKPDYMRLSQAERELAEKKKGMAVIRDN